MAGKQEAVVLFDYDQTQDDELTLKVGQVIQDVMEMDEGWCEGTLSGKRGMFPDNFVKMRPAPTPAPAPPVSTAPPTTAPPPADSNRSSVLRDTGKAIKTRRSKVAYSYAAENSDELSLEPGEMVEIIAEEEEGWFRGRLDGKEGVFPSNFLENPAEALVSVQTPEEPPPPKQQPSAMGKKLFPSIDPAMARAQLKQTKAPPPAQEKKAPPPPVPASIPVKQPEKPPEKQKHLERARVTYGYIADNEDELSIEVGDIVEVLNKDVGQEGWWEAKLRDKAGLVPDNFLILLPATAPAHPPPPSKSKAPPPLPTESKPPPPQPNKEAPSKPLPPRSTSVSKPRPPQPDSRPPPPAEPRHPPSNNEHQGEDNADFGVPPTDPLDSSAVKSRPKKTSRPPSRSNLHMEENGGSEPVPSTEPQLPVKQERHASQGGGGGGGGLTPWQAELQKRKAKPPPPKALVKKPVKTPAPPAKPSVASHKPPPPAFHSKPNVEAKPPAEPTPPPPRETPSPHPTSASPTPSSTPQPTPGHVAAAPSSHIVAPPPSDGQWKEAYEKLHDEFEKFKEFVKEQFQTLTDDLDEERKHWRGLEVDIDRLKKRANFSK